MRPNLYLSVATTLEQRLRSEPDFVFSSIAEMALQNHVAYQTMWKAARELAQRGVLRIRQGTKTRRTADDRDTRIVSSADVIYAQVKDGIETGHFRSGTRLPKMAYLASTHGVTTVTISRAFRRLASENLAFCHGRRWMVGPKPAPNKSGSLRSISSDTPVVVMLYNNATAWSSDVDFSFANLFLTPLSGELLQARIKTAPCMREIDEASQGAVPSGMDEVRAYIRSLGSRYAGTFTTSVHPQQDGLEEWIPQLLRYNKPVVYFDQADAGQYLTRRFFSVKKGYYRLHQDEPAGVAIALEHLWRWGHRTIAVPGAQIDALWAMRRAETVRAQARAMREPIDVAISSGIDADLDSWSNTLSSVQKLAIRPGSGGRHSEHEKNTRDRYRRLLVEKTPSFVSILKESHATALVCLNDQMARNYYMLMRGAGIEVPAQISLVSFDNLSASLFFPISTIDWGFGQLGYCAAHILIGDIPIRADRNGNIPGICALADRDSIGKPGDPADLVRMLK